MGNIVTTLYTQGSVVRVGTSILMVVYTRPLDGDLLVTLGL